MENNIYLSLAKARIEIQKKCTTKSGHNKFAGFSYFELKDFLSVATDELYRVGLVAIFNIVKNVDDNGLENEVATLTITNGKEQIVFETPTANALVKGANEIQNLGSKHTYLKRYLYMNAIELNESDGVDATIGKDEPKEAATTTTTTPKATDKQIAMIKQLYAEDELQDILNKNNITIENLSVQNASKLIAKKRGNQ